MKHLRPRSPKSTSRPQRSLSARLACALAPAAVLMTWPAAARADVETEIGIDFNYNNATSDFDADPGAGVDLYFGPRLNLAVLTLATELSAGMHDFGGFLDPALYRAMAGGRVGLGFIIRPSVFAHLGVGHLRYDDLLDDDRTGHTNIAGDLGVALDFTLLPLVDLGVQGSYNFLAGDSAFDAFEWMQAGVHITFIIDES